MGACLHLLHGVDSAPGNARPPARGERRLTPERALEQLRRIQHHRIRINCADTVTGVSFINKGQSEVLSALQVKKPVASQQLTRL